MASREPESELTLMFDGPSRVKLTVVLAHGAGAPMDSPFLEYFAQGLAAARFRVARFEFPYMRQRRAAGNKRPPDRLPKLLESWHGVIRSLDGSRLVIGGKSMGGRIASLVADEARVAGMLLLGYPFHPAGKPDRLRVEHLEKLATPTLLLQGTRDPMGRKEEVAEYRLSPKIRVRWLEDGDHSFKPRKASGRTQEQNLDQAVAEAVKFLREI